jgi:hypothetical protein
MTPIDAEPSINSATDTTDTKEVEWQTKSSTKP